MIERDERRPLPSRGDIGGAKLVDHGNARCTSQRLAIADLPGAAVGGAMQHRLAVKPEKRDVAGFQCGFLEQGRDRCAMGIRQKPLGLGNVGGHRTFGRRVHGRFQGRAEHGASPGVIGERERRARYGDGFAVGIEDRGVDAIERGSAHQADHFKNVRHLCYPGRPFMRGI